MKGLRGPGAEVLVGLVALVLGGLAAWVVLVAAVSLLLGVVLRGLT